MLSKCRYREERDDGRCDCHSNCLIVSGPIPLSICEKCSYIDVDCELKRKQREKEKRNEKELGDIIEQALTKVGITKERVEKWIGSCGCNERKEKLNRWHRRRKEKLRKLGHWAKRFVKGESNEEEIIKLMDEPCVYLRDKAKKQTTDGREVYQCAVHEFCVTEGDNDEYASCARRCRSKLPLSHRRFTSRFVDHLKIYDRNRRPTEALRDMLASHPSFLVCGGPSAKQQDLGLLEQRGIFSLAINNMAGYYRASAFTCSDPPKKFHNGIWLDPRVMKIIPVPKMRERRGALREKVGDEFKDLVIDDKKIASCHCPNLWGFDRRSWMKPDDSFFTEDTATWGNHDAGVMRTGEKKTVCTMLLGLRLLYYLGSRRIYLVGVDFKMDHEVGLYDNYAFGEERQQGAVNTNNSQYSVVNEWLVKMQKDDVFSKFGLEIYNCNSNSHLRAFEHVPFQDAVDDALSNFPVGPFDLVGWYNK